MDSVTQAALGAAIGEAVLGKKIGRKASVIGAVIATVPDLDVFLFLFYSRFEMLSIHRGFSHSILFSLLGASVIAFLLARKKWGKNITYTKLWIVAWLCLFTHSLLDAFTAYGTQLLLPFSDKRIGFDSINVVAPVYTLPLLIGVGLSLTIFYRGAKRSIPNNIGLIVSSLYLILTLGIKQQVNTHFENELQQKEIAYTSLMTMPVGIANINWYGVARSADSLYMHKYSIFEDANVSFEVFAINDHLLDEVDAQMAEKMRWFAKGFYTVEKVDGTIRIYNLQVDMRGIIKTEKLKAPTHGYFELYKNADGEFEFGSGTVKDL